MIRRPFGAEAVRHLALDHGRPQRAFATIVDRFDLAGKVAKGQQLIAGARDLGEEFSRDRTLRRCLQNVVDLALQRSPLGPHGRLRAVRHALGEGEDRVEP